MSVSEWRRDLGEEGGCSPAECGLTWSSKPSRSQLRLPRWSRGCSAVSRPQVGVRGGLEKFWTNAREVPASGPRASRRKRRNKRDRKCCICDIP